MVGAGSSSGSAAAGFYTAMPASETDGETFDGEADFDDYEEWDFAEMFSTAYVSELALRVGGCNYSTEVRCSILTRTVGFLFIAQIEKRKEVHFSALRRRGCRCLRHVSRCAILAFIVI